MTLAFMLAVDCGGTAGADDVLAKLGPLGPDLTAWKFTDARGHAWCTLVPHELELPAPAAEIERAARGLLDRLRRADGYRIALVGLEAATLLTGRSIDDPALTGVVVAEEVWRQAGAPAGFVAFAPGYLWRAPPPGFDWHTGV